MEKNLIEPRKKNQSNNFSKKEIRKLDIDCIFCGGKNKAVTIDHVPSKSIQYKNEPRPGSHMYGACKRCNAQSSLSDNVTGTIFRMEKTILHPPSEEEFERFIKTISKHEKFFFPMFSNPKTVSINIKDKQTEAISFKLQDNTIKLISQWYAKCCQAIYHDHFKNPQKIGSTITVNLVSKEKARRKFVQDLMARMPFASSLMEGKKFYHEIFSYHFLPSDLGNPEKIIIIPVVDDSHSAICITRFKKTMVKMQNTYTFTVTGKGLILTHKNGKSLRKKLFNQ